MTRRLLGALVPAPIADLYQELHDATHATECPKLLERFILGLACHVFYLPVFTGRLRE